MQRLKNYWWKKYLINPISLWTLVLINLIGSVYGYYWYHEQLAETPWYWWPLVPDSPLSSTLLMISLLLILYQRINPGIALWGNLSAIKYGIWAAIINIDYWRLSRIFTWENWMLTISHLGMAAEGFLLLLILPFSRKHIFLVATWFVVNDGLDYILNLHPYLFENSQYTLAWTSVVSLSIGLILISWKLKKSYKNGQYL